MGKSGEGNKSFAQSVGKAREENKSFAQSMGKSGEGNKSFAQSVGKAREEEGVLPGACRFHKGKEKEFLD